MEIMAPAGRERHSRDRINYPVRELNSVFVIHKNVSPARGVYGIAQTGGRNHRPAPVVHRCPLSRPHGREAGAAPGHQGRVWRPGRAGRRRGAAPAHGRRRAARRLGRRADWIAPAAGIHLSRLTGVQPCMNSRIPVNLGLRASREKREGPETADARRLSEAWRASKTRTRTSGLPRAEDACRPGRPYGARRAADRPAGGGSQTVRSQT